MFKSVFDDYRVVLSWANFASALMVDEFCLADERQDDASRIAAGNGSCNEQLSFT